MATALGSIVTLFLQCIVVIFLNNLNPHHIISFLLVAVLAYFVLCIICYRAATTHCQKSAKGQAGM